MSFWSQFGFPDPGTKIMQDLIWYHDLACMTMVGIVSGIGLFLVSFFSCGYWNKSIKKNEKVEFWWTLLPALWLVFLSYPSLQNLFKMECDNSMSGVLVEVMGHQWYWSYKYSWQGGRLLNFDSVSFGDSSENEDIPDFVGEGDFVLEYDSFMIPTDELDEGDYRLLEVDHRVVMPVGKTTVSVCSADVIHSWSIPSLAVKMDAVPGKHNILGLTIDRCGIYYGQCAEICGVNHSYMPIVVEVIPRDFFWDWCLYNLGEGS